MISVTALHRYPVKSLQGMAVERLDLLATGFSGDRRWALVADADGRLLSAKRHSVLLMASADDEAVTLPDGTRLSVDDAETSSALSDWLDRPVTLTEAATDTAVAYEMTFEPPNDDAEYIPIDAPPGSFLDLAAGHLLTVPTVQACARRYPDLDWDLRRFRPNVVVDGDLEPFAEDGWCGRTVRLGTAELLVRQPTVRCAMPLRAQPGGLERQPELYGALEDVHGNHLGLYLDVVTPGAIELGDEVVLSG